MFLPNPGVLSAGAGGPVVGQQLFTASGTFIVPSGVSSICVVCISPGKSSSGTSPGFGGNLRYANDIPVSGRESLTVIASSPSPFTGTPAALQRGAEVLCRASDTGIQTGTGFNGGSWNDSPGGGGGAATFTSDGIEGYASPYRGGNGTSPYGSSVPPTVATGLNGAAYGGGAASESDGGPGCVYIIYGPGRAFPNSMVAPIT